MHTSNDTGTSENDHTSSNPESDYNITEQPSEAGERSHSAISRGIDMQQSIFQHIDMSQSLQSLQRGIIQESVVTGIEHSPTESQQVFVRASQQIQPRAR